MPISPINNQYRISFTRNKKNDSIQRQDTKPLSNKPINKANEEYSVNTNPHSQVLSDGTFRELYKNGTVKREIYADGTQRGWDEDGNLRYETYQDGIIWLDKNGFPI